LAGQAIRDLATLANNAARGVDLRVRLIAEGLTELYGDLRDGAGYFDGRVSNGKFAEAARGAEPRSAIFALATAAEELTEEITRRVTGPLAESAKAVEKAREEAEIAAEDAEAKHSVAIDRLKDEIEGLRIEIKERKNQLSELREAAEIVVQGKDLGRDKDLAKLAEALDDQHY